MQVGERLLVKEGSLSSNWVHVFTDASHFSLNGDRMITQWTDGQCFAKAQGITQSEGITNPLVAGGAPVGGHSLSLLRRNYFASFMAGANLLDVEGGSVACFFGPNKLNGMYSLSPLGFVVRDFYGFTKTNSPARPQPWAPIGLVLNREHGLGLESFPDTSKPSPPPPSVFCLVPASNGDLMNISLLQTIWPGSLPFPTDGNNIGNETGVMVNTPFGDLFDVLIADTDSLILDYPVLYLSGAITVDDTLANKLQTYVNAGGNLVLNSQHFGLTAVANLAGVQIGSADLQMSPQQLTWNATNEAGPVFSDTLTYRAMTPSTAKPLLTALDVNGSQVVLATINTVGTGRVIVTGPAYLSRPDIVGFLLGHLAISTAVTPFIVTGAIQYLVNYGPADNWALTLINNAGVTKQPTTDEVIDSSKAVIVTVTYQQPGWSLDQVIDAASGATLPVPQGAWTFQVTVPAGDLVVLKVQTQPIWAQTQP